MLMLLAFLLLFTVPLGTEIVHVKADVPTVLSITPWMSGENTILNITIRHADPSSFHYINQVEVDKDGTVQSISLSAASTVIFTVQYNLGVVTGTPDVRARVHCVTHGWSGWSSSIIVPEFSSMFFPILLASLTLLTVVARTKLKTRNWFTFTKKGALQQV